MKKEFYPGCFLTEEEEQELQEKSENMLDYLREILPHTIDHVYEIENLEEIHGYIQELISDHHKKNPDVLNQTIVGHYYVKKWKLHFYATNSFKNTLYGYLVNEFGILAYSVEPLGKWNRFRCKEDCAVPRTMADVVKELN